MIFPLLESNGRWNGQEYLQIYPCIQKKDYGDYFYVVYPNGDSISLVDWLKNDRLWVERFLFHINMVILLFNI